jgi:hypothetical protein
MTAFAERAFEVADVGTLVVTALPRVETTDDCKEVGQFRVDSQPLSVLE